MISSRKGSSSVSDSPDRLLPSGTTITGVNWLEPRSVSKCVCARQVNCGTSADGIRGPAGSVSVRLRVHALAGVHDGLALNRTRPQFAIEPSQPSAFCSHQTSLLGCFLEGTHDCGTGMDQAVKGSPTGNRS